MITIVDYGAGNIRSVQNACTALGVPTIVTMSADEVLRAEKILLPGVGAFGAAMRELALRGLIAPLTQRIREGVPFLGICLGMQLLFEESDENPDVSGLGVITGRCVRVPTPRVPNIGWCKTIVGCTDEEQYFYYVHSFCVVPCDTAVISMREKESGFCAGVAAGNIWGVQFHPEKSGDAGLAFLKRWCEQ